MSVRWGRLALAAAVAAALPLAFAVPTAAGSPLEELRASSERVVRVLEDPAFRGKERRQARLEAIRQVALEMFDALEAARRALGRHWQARTPAERQRFARLFVELLEHTYRSRLDRYGGERVRYLGEVVDGDHAVVKARVTTKKGTEVPVEARMLHRDDRWRVYDVLVENVSLLANYRAQFDQIIRTSSYEELVRRLERRRDEQASADGSAAAPGP